MTTTENISEQIVPTDPRVEKLPKWAQDHIALLRMRLSEARADANNARTRGPEDTDTFAEPYSQSPIYLPVGARVVFRLAEGRDITAHVIHGRNGETYLDVTASGFRGGSDLYVSPQASNVVRLTTGDL
jgi:hypothetical protein